MSYARLIQPIGDLPIGTEIKNVRAKPYGYEFWAKRQDKTWASVLTLEDLPALTDKGAAQRATRAQRVTMQRGRPTASSEPTSRTITVRLTAAQRSALETRCAAVGVKVSEVVKRCLIEAGLIPS